MHLIKAQSTPTKRNTALGPSFFQEADPIAMHDTLDVLPAVAAAVENLHQLLQLGDRVEIHRRLLGPVAAVQV